MRGDVLEAGDLLVLGAQVHDRVEDEVGEAKGPVDPGRRRNRRSSPRSRSAPGSRAAARPSPRERSMPLHADAAPAQRQRDPAGADRRAPSACPVAAPGRPGSHRRVDDRRREHVVGRRRRSAPPPARRSSSRSRRLEELDAVPGRIVDEDLAAARAARGSRCGSAPHARGAPPRARRDRRPRGRAGSSRRARAACRPASAARRDAPGPASQTVASSCLTIAMFGAELALEHEAERLDEERDRGVDVGDDVADGRGQGGGSTGV